MLSFVFMNKFWWSSSSDQISYGQILSILYHLYHSCRMKTFADTHQRSWEKLQNGQFTWSSQTVFTSLEKRMLIVDNWSYNYYSMEASFSIVAMLNIKYKCHLRKKNRQPRTMLVFLETCTVKKMYQNFMQLLYNFYTIRASTYDYSFTVMG